MKQTIGIDKLVHAFLFGTLCYLCIAGRTRQFGASGWHGRIAAQCLLFSILYGIATEGIQYFVKYRSFDTMDMLANSLGAVIGFLLYRALKAKRHTKSGLTS